MDSLSSFWNVKGLSEYLALKSSKIYSMVEERQIPHYRINRQIRFKKSEIEKWLEEHKEPAVDTKIETKKVFRFIEKKADLDFNRIIKRVVEQSKKKGYNLSQEKPGRIKDLGKEAEDGII